MSESEKKTEWRDIWQEIIETSRIVLRRKEKDLEGFKCLDAKYPDDKMLIFEKAITAECLNNEELAKKYYLEASDEKTGLPVKHWKERAKYFLDRINERGCNKTTYLNPNDELFQIQWNTYFNIHAFENLDDYLCYLSISSVSRIHSEPAMAIVVFRTCLELGLWSYYKENVEKINKEWKNQDLKKRKHRDIGLDDLLKELHEQKIIKNNEYEVFDIIRAEGNLANHPKNIKKAEKPFRYLDQDLIDILIAFNQTMQILNEHAN